MSARCVRLASRVMQVTGHAGHRHRQVRDKVALIRSGEAPIIERGIGDLVVRNIENGRLSATMDAADLTVTDIAEAVDWAETIVATVIVATVSDPVYETGIAGARPDQTILNFARYSSERRPPTQEGFL
jgi:UDP-glucose 6-dehydrogenase